MRLPVLGSADTPRKPRGMFVVLLPTLECNLSCTYCFEKHPRGRWDVATTERVLGSLVELALHEGATSLRLQWQGGEALLMGVEYWSSVLETAERACDAAGIILDQTLQTNLVSYSTRMGELVHRYFGGKLGTSFEDAPGRRFPGGDTACFVDAWRAAFSQARDEGIQVGVISLLGEAALREGAPSFLERMRDGYGIDRLRVNLPFQQGLAGGYWVDPIAAGTFLSDAYRWWVAHGRDEGFYLKPMRFLEETLSTGSSSEPGLCIFSRNCSEVALTVTPRGDVTLCDSFAFTGQAEGYGNLFEEPLIDVYQGAKRQKVHSLCQSLITDKCLSCRFLPTCHGGCLVRTHGVGSEDPDFHYCETYKMLFSAMEDEIARNRHRDAPRALASC